MTEAAEVRRAANPHEILLVADALTGQDAVNLARSVRRARRPHRHRAHAGRRRRPRRRGAVDARGDRQADQAHRHRRKTRRHRGLSSGAHRRSHPRHGRHRLAGGEGGRDHRRREGGARRREDAQGRLRSLRSARAAGADAAHGRHERPDVDAAGDRQDEEPARRAQSRRDRAEAADGDHRFDDAAGTAQPGRAQGEPQAAHRRRLRHQAGGHQSPLENAPHHGRRDEGDGRRGKRGPMAGLANMLGLGGRRHAEPGGDGEARGKNAGRVAAGNAGRRRTAAEFPRIARRTTGELPGGLPGGLPGLGPKLPGGLPGGFPGLGKKK